LGVPFDLSFNKIGVDFHPFKNEYA